VSFKHNVYKKALHELAPLLFPDGVPACPKKTAHRARTR
jgi:hypothetical protein